MKIVHIALECPYTPGFTYQENLLPKYQAKLGYDVSLITTDYVHNGDGTYKNVEREVFYDCGVQIIRFSKHFYKNKISNIIFQSYFILGKLIELKPELIMLHGIGYSYSKDVKKYLKINPKCILIGDNHIDEYNTHYKKNFSYLFKNIIIKHNLSYIKNKYSIIYGVTEGRCDYIRNFYGLKKVNIDLLPAGVDSDKADYENRETIRDEIRKKLSINNDDFVIISGGKIDYDKKIIELMKSISIINNSKIHLIIFGKVNNNIEKEFTGLLNNLLITYVGWLDTKSTYNYFFASDLAFFPGLHSVLWEQAVGCGVPAVFNDLKGLHHFDVGGNCIFLQNPTINSICDVILKLFNNQDKLNQMKTIAIYKGIQTFSYNNIARKSLQVLNVINFKNN